MSNENKATGHDLDTSEGARAYIAEFFANQVRRHDFRAYITTRLAADFACALAQYLAAQPSPTDTGIPTSPSPADQGYALDLDRVLSLADVHAEESREDGTRLLDRGGLLAFAQDVAAALAARQPVGENPAWRDELVREAHNRGLADGLNADRQSAGQEPVVISKQARECLQEIIDNCWRDEDQVVASEIGRLMRGPLYAAPPAQVVDDDWHLRGYAYASKQATTCAGCGEHKHTPLRIDAMGGYVCLTCIDKKLSTLLGEFGYESAQAVDLGQFRECVELMEWQERGHANPDFPTGDPKKHAEALHLLALIDSQAVGRESNNEPNRLTDRAESIPVMLKGIGKINGDGWKDTTTIGEVVFVWPTERQKPYAPGQYDRVGNKCGWTASTSQYDFQPATHAEVREFVEAMATESWERAAELDRLNPDRAVACGQASIITKDSTNG
ncbi:hypothetical protein [Stenotrophomonas maltophilia]|uniref:hypothetical protein n=1 Tax=Stenotrophomonas maltophilia TaxID=40324 RepID=UPI0039F73E8A